MPKLKNWRKTILTIKDHGKYNILIITALHAYQQLYAHYELIGFPEHNGKHKTMLELEKALMDIEPDAVNEIKAKFE